MIELKTNPKFQPKTIQELQNTKIDDMCFENYNLNDYETFIKSSTQRKVKG